MKPLRIHCFQHVEFEDMGCIKEWCINKGHSITYTKFFGDAIIPPPEDYDWLIIMGGPMNIYDEQQHSWLKDEKAAILNAIQQDKTILGICLGSQLIADVLGAKVYSNGLKEIGWFDISLTEQGNNEPLFLNIPPKIKVFHWHGDTFELPQNAVHLASSAACKNQAFLYNKRVLGLQFHFEVTEESLRKMVEHGRKELSPGEFVQNAEEILSGKENISTNNTIMFKVLDNLATISS